MSELVSTPEARKALASCMAIELLQQWIADDDLPKTRFGVWVRVSKYVRRDPRVQDLPWRLILEMIIEIIKIILEMLFPAG